MGTDAAPTRLLLVELPAAASLGFPAESVKFDESEAREEPLNLD